MNPISSARARGTSSNLPAKAHALRGVLAAAAVAVGVLLALAPAAGADTEPNDAIWQAEGQISGGTAYTGSLAETQDFADWYLFYVDGIQQIHLVPMTSDDTCVRMALTNGDEDVPNDYTTPLRGANTLYVKVFASFQKECGGEYTYAFRLEAASAIGTGPTSLPPTDTGEPNETNSTAFGPLAATTLYRGSIDTQNDQDQFFFRTAPGTHQLSVTAYLGTQPTGYPHDFWGDGIEVPRCEKVPRFYITTGLGQRTVADLTPGNDYSADEFEEHADTYAFTSSASQDYVINIVGFNDEMAACNQWHLRVDPPSALKQATSAPQESPLCLKSRRLEVKYERKLAADRKRLRRARDRRSARRLRRLIAAERRTLRRIRDKVVIYCQPN